MQHRPKELRWYSEEDPLNWAELCLVALILIASLFAAGVVGASVAVGLGAALAITYFVGWFFTAS